MKKAAIDPSVTERADAFNAVAKLLNMPANKDLVLAEINKLITIEDQAPQKDALITELKGQIADFEEKVKELVKDHDVMTEKLVKQTKTIEDQGREIATLSGALQELKTQLQQASDTFNLSGIQLIVKGFSKIILRR